MESSELNDLPFDIYHANNMMVDLFGEEMDYRPLNPVKPELGRASGVDLAEAVHLNEHGKLYQPEALFAGHSVIEPEVRFAK